MYGTGAERFAPLNSPLFWKMVRDKVNPPRRVTFNTYQGAMDAGARKITEGYIVTVGQFERKWMVFYW